jgi:hypothetical protein
MAEKLVCSECPNKFTPYKSGDLTCGDKCALARKTRLQKERRHHTQSLFHARVQRRKRAARKAARARWAAVKSAQAEV